MLAAVQFNDQMRFGADEIGNVGAKRMLAAEAEAAQLMATKMEPETGFGVGHAAA